MINAAAINEKLTRLLDKLMSWPRWRNWLSLRMTESLPCWMLSTAWSVLLGSAAKASINARDCLVKREMTLAGARCSLRSCAMRGSE